MRPASLSVKLTENIPSMGLLLLVGLLSAEAGIVRRLRRCSPTESASVCKRRIRLRHVATGTDLVAGPVRISSRLRLRVA